MNTISFNALYIDQINTMRQLVANIASYNFNKFTYEGLAKRMEDDCKFLEAEYILEGQNSHGYKRLMSCEDSDLLTDIAHGLNRFINGNHKFFGQKRKADLEGVFLEYRGQLDFLCRATLSELNAKSDLVFELPHVSYFTSERVVMYMNGVKQYALKMAEFLPALKEDMKRKETERATRENDFEAVITEENLTRYTHSKDIFTFYRPNGELFVVTVGNGGQQGKYFVCMALLGRIGSHLATRRKELKKNGFVCDSVAEILKDLRNFLKEPVSFGELSINDNFEITFESGLTVTAIKTSSQCCAYQHYGKLKANIVLKDKTVYRLPEAPEMAYFVDPDQPRHSYIVKRSSFDSYMLFHIVQHKEVSRKKYYYQELVDQYDFIDMDVVDNLQYDQSPAAQRLSDLKWDAGEHATNDAHWRMFARNHVKDIALASHSFCVHTSREKTLLKNLADLEPGIEGDNMHVPKAEELYLGCDIYVNSLKMKMTVTSNSGLSGHEFGRIELEGKNLIGLTTSICVCWSELLEGIKTGEYKLLTLFGRYYNIKHGICETAVKKTGDLFTVVSTSKNGVIVNGQYDLHNAFMHSAIPPETLSLLSHPV